MTFIEIIGYFGALFIGMVMGLTGSGGSILSVPILAYLFKYDEKTATAYSLFIVGVTAILGSIRVIRAKMVNVSRSEERRVGKECRYQWSPLRYDIKRGCYRSCIG